MSNTYNRMISALFCTALVVGGGLIFLTPDRDFSPTENRYLKQFPNLKAEDFTLAWPMEESGDFFTGAWMSEFETYVTDQFPGRDGWITAKAQAEVTLGKGENNGIYICDKETLIPRFEEPNMTLVEKNLGYVNAMTQKLHVPVHFGLIPGKVSVWADRLPDNAPNASESEILELAQSTTQANWVDVNTELTAHADEDIYYRLDHHWNSLGAYYGYTALCEAMGLTPAPLGEKTTVSTDFNGTTYSSSGVRWMTPDQMDIYISEEDLTVTALRGAQPEPSGLYDWSKLEEKDKYSFFLGGNQSLGKIVTEHTDAPKLLVIRDSYSDSIAPFLTQNFSEVHLFDARYNKTPIAQYVAQNDIDQVLVLYSVNNFVSDGNLYVLGM